jgi:sigma-B regulation protein RsbU (phosphoserine phosphatase)
MTASAQPGGTSSALSEHPVTALLVDDQPIVGEAVRRMLADNKEITLHFCQDPTKAIETANTVNPTVILQDLVMPEIDGLTLVKFFRANDKTRDVPMIVLSTKEEPTIKAQAFALGANDYLVKLPDKIELIARIRHHSKGYINLLERNEAYRKLEESQRQLAEEVAQAAKYVASLLPEPMTGDVQIEWRFIPSTQLGGDSFGYHWLDPDHLAIYVLDVSGHGVGASLLSVSAMNVLSSRALPGTDFRDPAQVLRGLNGAFPMERHDNKYFTIWYGVYQKSARRLVYSGGGHPAGLLYTGPSRAAATLHRLESHGPGIGFWADADFETAACAIGPYARLFLFSDGVYEIARPDGTMWKFNDFVAYLSELPEDAGLIDRVLKHVRDLQGSDTLADDFSMLQVTF